jgi:hypothetical protein
MKQSATAGGRLCTRVSIGVNCISPLDLGINTPGYPGRALQELVVRRTRGTSELLAATNRSPQPGAAVPHRYLWSLRQVWAYWDRGCNSFRSWDERGGTPTTETRRHGENREVGGSENRVIENQSRLTRSCSGADFSPARCARGFEMTRRGKVAKKLAAASSAKTSN